MADLTALRNGAATPTVEGPPKFAFTQAGEEVYGTVTDARFDIVTPHGTGDLIELNDEQRGPITVWLGNVQLNAGLVQGRNQLGRKVAIGDTVYIRFDGKTAVAGGKTLSNFAINLAPGAAVAPVAAPPATPPAAPFPTPV